MAITGALMPRLISLLRRLSGGSKGSNARQTMKQTGELLRHTHRVSLELSNLCNLARAHSRCPAHFVRSPHVLAGPVVRDVLDTLGAAAFGAGRYIAFHLYNEPLLDPRLFSFVQHARARCPEAGIIIWSNGWYLTENIACELACAGVTHFMLSAYSRRAHERFEALRLRLRADLSTCLGSDHLPVYFRIRKCPGLDDRMEMTAPPEKPDPRPCHQPLSDLTIRASGSLGLCCYDWAEQKVFGNLNRQRFAECLSAQAADLAALHRDLCRGIRTLPVCEACHFPRRHADRRAEWTWPEGTKVFG
jgi:hypothetical protein